MYKVATHGCGGVDMDVAFILNKLRQISQYTVPIKHSNKNTGFTFIELLITLVISSLVITFAAPEFRTLINSNDAAVTINTLVSDFAFSRNEAIKRMNDVVICKSSDNQTCTSDTAWQAGWIIYVDNVSQDMQRSVDEPILKVQQALGNHIKIKFTSFNSKNKVVYRPSGAADYSNGTFRFCINNKQYHKDLVLSRTGRTYLKVNQGDIFKVSSSC